MLTKQKLIYFCLWETILAMRTAGVASPWHYVFVMIRGYRVGAGWASVDFDWVFNFCKSEIRMKDNVIYFALVVEKFEDLQ